jgi:sortase A
LFSVGGAAVIKRSEKTTPIRAAAAPTTTTTATPTTVPPPPTTVAAPLPRQSKPVSNPGSYAPEPIVEIGMIEIPKIGLNHRVMEGITLRNIDFGPSHWPGTAFPGENGNAVFAGHRVTHTHPFLRINELEPGDLVIFHIQGRKSTYSMTSSQIVFPNQLEIVNQTEEPTATLFACHPPHSAKQRYVVHLALVETVAE